MVRLIEHITARGDAEFYSSGKGKKLCFEVLETVKAKKATEWTLKPFSKPGQDDCGTLKIPIIFDELMLIQDGREAFPYPIFWSSISKCGYRDCVTEDCPGFAARGAWKRETGRLAPSDEAFNKNGKGMMSAWAAQCLAEDMGYDD